MLLWIFSPSMNLYSGCKIEPMKRHLQNYDDSFNFRHTGISNWLLFCWKLYALKNVRDFDRCFFSISILIIIIIVIGRRNACQPSSIKKMFIVLVFYWIDKLICGLFADTVMIIIAIYGSHQAELSCSKWMKNVCWCSIGRSVGGHLL